MRRTDVLILAARAISRNKANADGTYGIDDNEFLQYLNDAQDRLQNLICAKKNMARIFSTQQIIDVVANQEAYTIPDRVLLNKEIQMVEFSYDGSLANYAPLEKVNLFNRDTNSTNYPTGYFKRGGAIYLQPTPSVSSGTIRVTYERALDDLDIPRGVISVIGSGTSVQFATVTLDSTANSYETTTPGWSTIQYISFVSAIGARKCYNVLSGGYDTGTNIFTPSPTPFLYTANDSELAVGDVAVFGKYTTTFSQLPDECERYLIHYAATQAFQEDSSNDRNKAMEMLEAIEDDVLTALASQTSEVELIPLKNMYDYY